MEGHLSNEKVATQLFGPHLAWKTSYRGSDSTSFGDHLQVRNWKTGCIVWVRSLLPTKRSFFVALKAHGVCLVGHQPPAPRFFVYVY